MSVSQRLTEVFDKSVEIPFDDSSKFILFSDVHRGDNSWADDFAHNQNVFFHALDHYNRNGFTFIELGDGDELWENRSFKDIRKAHSHVFWMMRNFHEDKRLYLIWGNHNRKWRRAKNMRKYLYQYYDEREQSVEPLFQGIMVHEGLKLKHQTNGKTLFLVHGHQGDLLNDQWWWFGRFVVRTVWKPFQNLGIKDPTRPAKNFKRRDKIEKEVVKWSKANNQAIVIGHTHRPSFPGENKPPYFNTGSCVHPRSITGIEIENGEIALIKWFIDVKMDEVDEAGTLFINRETLVGPRKLKDLL